MFVISGLALLQLVIVFIAKLVLNTLRKMHKTEFYLNIYTDGRNTNLRGYYCLSGGTRIPSGADMLADTYRVPGNYACIENTIASSLKNCPVSKAFVLKVDLATGNSYPRQTFLQFNNGKVFTRTFDSFENRWTETFSNITNADLPILTVRTGTRYWTQAVEVSGQKRIYFYNADFPSAENMLGYVALTKP